MFKPVAVFSGFSVDNLSKAKKFYSEVLGLKVEEKMGLQIHLPGGGVVYVYDKENHKPATFTILNFEVEDIDTAVADLTKKGVKLEIYKDFGQDKMGIASGISQNRGSNIAWFKDP